MTKTTTKRIFGLDFMRFFAIMFVVVTHCLWAFPEAEGPIVSLIKLSGVMGVEIFFVLSGFLIGRILYRIFVTEDRNSGSLYYFLIRRWFRTLPNYYLVLLLNILVVWYVGRSLPDSLINYFFFLQNFNSEIAPFFTESWSLSIEEFAYIIGPLLCYILLKLKLPVSKNAVFLGVTLFIIFFFLGTKVYYNAITGPSSLAYWNGHLKAVLVYRVDAIYYGVLAAYISIQWTTIWKDYASILMITGGLCFVGLHAMIGTMDMNPETYPFFINVLYFPICSLCIALSLPLLSKWNKAPNWFSRPITFVSRISYAMYVLHYSIILVLLRYWFSPETLSFAQQWFFALAYIGCTLFFSAVLYVIFEKPVMDIRDRPFFKDRFQKNNY